MLDLELLNLPTFTRPGICEGAEDPDLWHSNRLTEQAEAKRICGECPAREECLTWALDQHETDGIWGGLDPRQRKQIRDTQQRRARRARRAPRNPKKRTPAGTCGVCGSASYSPLASYCDTCIHGTAGGRPYHLNRGENPCDTCRDGERARHRDAA